MNPPKNHSINNGVLLVGETRVILSHITSYRADTSSIILTLPHGQMTLNTGAETAEVVAIIDEIAENPLRIVQGLPFKPILSQEAIAKLRDLPPIIDPYPPRMSTETAPPTRRAVTEVSLRCPSGERTMEFAGALEVSPGHPDFISQWASLGEDVQAAWARHLLQKHEHRSNRLP